ncbi:PEGA domain-containing protein [Polyangium spumosum]|nr:PEGA domain-containing protein [Polyangium spumosum]
MTTMSKAPLRSAALAAAVSALLVSSAGMASGPADAARKHFNAGLVARGAGHWDEAYAEFTRAYLLSKEPRYVANLGLAELKVGKPRAAVAHLSSFLREAIDASDEDRMLIAKLLLEARSKLGALRVRVDEPGVEVLVDGVVVGRGPLMEVLVEPGPRRVTARKPGVRFATETVDVRPGDAPREMRIGREVAGVGPVESHGAGGATKPAERPTNWKPWAIAGSAVVSAAGFGLGAGMVLHANGLASEANATAKKAEEEARKELWETPLEAGDPRTVEVCAGVRQEMCDSYDSLSARHAEAVRWATAGFIVGGVAAAATITLLLLPNAEQKRSSMTVLPVLGDGVRGIGVVGSF